MTWLTAQLATSASRDQMASVVPLATRAAVVDGGPKATVAVPVGGGASSLPPGPGATRDDEIGLARRRLEEDEKAAPTGRAEGHRLLVVERQRFRDCPPPAGAQTKRRRGRSGYL